MKRSFWPPLWRSRAALLTLPFLLVAAFSQNACSKNTPTVPPAQSPRAGDTGPQSYTFTTPPTFDELAVSTQQRGIQIESISINFDDFTTFYTVGCRNLSEIRDDFAAKHAGFLKVIGNSTDAGLADLRAHCAQMRVHDVGAMRITAIEVRNPNAAAVAAIGGVVADEPISDTETESPADELNNDAGKTNSLYHEQWAPYGGTSEVQNGYLYETFFFNHAEFFGDPDTYEHETHFSNSSFADFGGYASTNLPAPYLHNEVPEPSGVDNFCVGSAHATRIANGVRYFVYQTLRHQSASTSTVRVKGQWHRRGWGCYAWWCAGLRGTTASMATHTAPSGMSYQY